MFPFATVANRVLGKIKTILGLGPKVFLRADVGVNGKLAVDDFAGIGRMEGTSASKDDELIQSSFSIACWFKRNSGTSGAIFAREGTGGYVYFEVDNNRLKARFFQGGTGANALSTSANITTGTNTYHFGVATFDHTAKQISLYVDGSLQTLDVTQNGDYSAISDPSTTTISNPFFTHNRSGTPTYPLLGAIDQLICFEKVLSLPEITELYNGGSGLKYGDLTGSETFYSSINRWFDCDSPANLGRESSQPSHAVNFDGSAGSFKISDTSTFSWGNGVNDLPFSMGGWFKFDDVTTSQCLFGRINDASSGTQYLVLLDNNDLYLRVYDTSTSNFRHLIANNVINTVGEWVHLVFTYDGTGGATAETGMEIYLNGVAVSNASGGAGTYSTMTASVDTFCLGYSAGAGVDTLFLNGAIDEAFVYSGELDETTHGEISTLYNGGIVAPARTILPTGNSATIISDWSFDGQTLATVGYDAHGSNDLTPSVGITEGDLVAGVVDARTQYADLAASSAYFSTTNVVPFEFGADGVTQPSFTINFIAKIQSGNSGAICYCGEITNSTNSKYLVRISSGGLFVYLTNNGFSDYWGVQPNTTFTAGQVYNITITYDGTNDSLNDFTFYIDGTLWSGILNDFGGGNPQDYILNTGAVEFVIGEQYGTIPTAFEYTEEIHKVAIFNTELTGADLNAIKDASLNSTIADYTGSKTNLVAWYDFENSADLGKDSHTGGLDLTINGTPTVGPARDTGLDLFENNITSANAVEGIVTGQVINDENVFQWTDLSGFDNHFTQATVANQPIYNAVDGAVSLTANNQLLVSTDSFDITGDHTFFFIFSSSDITVAVDFFRINNQDLIRNNNTGRLRSQGYTTALNQLTNNDANIYTIRAAAYELATQEMDFYHNGSFDGTRLVGAVISTSGTLSLEVENGYTFNLKAIVAYDKLLSVSEIETVYNELNGIFNIV